MIFGLGIHFTVLFVNLWVLHEHTMIFWDLFSVRLLSVLRGRSVFSSPPQRPMTSDFEGFLYQIPSITFIFLSQFLRKSQYFPFECSVLNKGTTGTIFTTSLVWRGPWLGIGPGTSRTRSQHYTTRLSRRRWTQW